MGIFEKKDVHYTAQKNYANSLSSQCYGPNSLFFSLLWDTIDDDCHLLKYLKRKYVAGMALTVHAFFAINLVLFPLNYIVGIHQLYKLHV